MAIEDAYNFACALTKQYLLRRITLDAAADLFEASSEFASLKPAAQDIAKIALFTLLRFSEMPKMHPSIAPERYTPQIRIENPKVARGYSIVVIDGMQAYKYVLRDARCASFA